MGLKAVLASIRDHIGVGGRYYRFGERDNFPNRIVEAANDSGTAMECIDKLETFISGEGLEDKSILKDQDPPNADQSWEEFIMGLDSQLAFFDGACVRVMFNNAGEPQQYHIVPLQHVRRKADGNFLYREGLGDPPGYYYNPSTTPYTIPAYDEDRRPAEWREIVKGQIKRTGKQQGAFIYAYKPGTGLLYDKYPVPKWASGLNDINADAALSVHEESQVSNSFKAGVIIATEKLDRTEADEEGYTEYDYFQQEVDKFTSPDGSSVLHIEGINDKAAPQVHALNIQHQMDATEQSTDRIAKKVCRLFSVPPILLGIETAGKLGNNQELVNYMKLFSLTLQKKWRLKEKVLQKLFTQATAASLKTKPLNLFEYLPDKVIEGLSDEQKASMFNLPEDQGGRKEPVSVQGIISVQQQIEKGATTLEGGVEVLKQVYGFTSEEAYKMLGGAEPGNTNEPRNKPGTTNEPVKREVNEHLKTLTGKQQQQLDRVVRKFGKEELSEQQAMMQLTTGFGFTEEEARTYLGIEETE